MVMHGGGGLVVITYILANTFAVAFIYGTEDKVTFEVLMRIQIMSYFLWNDTNKIIYLQTNEILSNCYSENKALIKEVLIISID